MSERRRVDEAVYEQIQAMCVATESGGGKAPRPAGRKFLTPWQLLRQHATAYTSHDLTREEYDHVKKVAGRRTFRMRECFQNAQKLALDDDSGRIRYCEGIGFHILPVVHGWVSIGDKVIDPTWSRFAYDDIKTNVHLEQKVLGAFGEETAYVGFDIDTEIVRDRILRAHTWDSLLFDWEHDFPFLAEGFVWKSRL